VVVADVGHEGEPLPVYRGIAAYPIVNHVSFAPDIVSKRANFEVFPPVLNRFQSNDGAIATNEVEVCCLASASCSICKTRLVEFRNIVQALVFAKEQAVPWPSAPGSTTNVMEIASKILCIAARLQLTSSLLYENPTKLNYSK
jgi:hypothetical protein